MSESETDDSKIEDLLRSIREKSLQGEYVYRGEPEEYDKISSALYRKYEGKIEAKKFDIQIAQKEMLRQVKEYTDFTDETDVLTELQHYGGKTNLIDFTTDYLIALFFACDGSPDKDGRVILLNRESNLGKITSPKKNQNNRVISQKSIFFQSPKGYLEDSEVEIISIRNEMKPRILDYLRKYHDIATHTIYNDIFGYIQNQEKHQSAYTEFFIGLTFQNNGKHEEAITHYDQAIRINPQAFIVYHNRGLAKKDLGRHRETIADLDEAIRINPQHADAYHNRGAAKGALNRHHDAITDFDEAIRINPQHANAYSNRGLAKFVLNQYHDAIADLDEAIRINPQHANAYNNRGLAKLALKRYRDAIADFDQSIHINPQHANASYSYYHKGKAHKAIEDYEEARAALQRALELATQQGNQALAQEVRRLLDALPPSDCAG